MFLDNYWKIKRMEMMEDYNNQDKEEFSKKIKIYDATDDDHRSHGDSSFLYCLNGFGSESRENTSNFSGTTDFETWQIFRIYEDIGAGLCESKRRVVDYWSDNRNFNVYIQRCGVFC